ncbi:MAG: ATP-binding cassette domain-containing protein [Bacteriovoracia bacterium]
MIDFSRVSKSLGGVRIIDEVSLHVPEGKQIALLGLSGSGKTTLIKLVCGLHFADSGSVTLAGIRLDDFPMILEGAVPAALLALLIQYGFHLVEEIYLERNAR